MTPLVIATTAVRRMARDRTALFFQLLLPIVVILVIGATVGGFDTLRVAVVRAGTGPVTAGLAEQLERSSTLEVVSFDDVDAAAPALRRGEVSAVVVLPADLDDDLKAGRDVTVPVLAEQISGLNMAALSAVDAVLSREAAVVAAARSAGQVSGRAWPQELPAARDLAARAPVADVRTQVVDAGSDYLPGGFSYSAPTMLVLFVFINAVASGAVIVQNRRLGIYERVLAAPVRPGQVVLGETLTYLSLALAQSLLIVGAGAWLFGVDWGDPAAATVLVGLWALVGTGAGMLSGTLFRTPEQASAIGPAVGIGLGMLGGCMWPLEIVGPVMQRVGHLAPHAWAVDAWTELLSRDGGLADVAGPAAVLAAFAATLLGTAVLRLRRRLGA